MRRRLTGAVVPALALAALAGFAALLVVSSQSFAPPEPPPRGCLLDPQALAKFGGPIALDGPGGSHITEANFAGAPAIVYFGYTHCPDICPTTMYDLTGAYEELGQSLRTVLITVDPERDSPEQLAAYLRTAGFPEHAVGLSGAPEQIRAAADAFHVIYRRAPLPGDDGAYNMDHSSYLYVMDGDWRARAIVPSIGVSSKDIARCIALGLDEGAAGSAGPRAN